MNAYPAAQWHLSAQPRIKPPPPRERSLLHRLILWMSRRKVQSKTNLVVIEDLLHMGILCPLYLNWMSGLLFKGRIPRADKERIVLRTVWRTGCLYEWTHHVHLARKSGVPDADIAALGSEHTEYFPPRQRCLVLAVDELLAQRALGEATFADLRKHLSEDECVEFLMLSGHYQMISMLINACGIPVEKEFALGRLPQLTAQGEAR